MKQNKITLFSVAVDVVVAVGWFVHSLVTACLAFEIIIICINICEMCEKRMRDDCVRARAHIHKCLMMSNRFVRIMMNLFSVFVYYLLWLFDRKCFIQCVEIKFARIEFYAKLTTRSPTINFNVVSVYRAWVVCIRAMSMCMYVVCMTVCHGSWCIWIFRFIMTIYFVLLFICCCLCWIVVAWIYASP